MIGELYFRAAVERVLREALKALGIRHGVVERRLVQRKDRLHKVIREVHACGLHILLKLIENRNLLAGGQVCRLHAALIGRGDVRDEHGNVSGWLR